MGDSTPITHRLKNWAPLDPPVVAFLVKATFQLWLLCMNAGGDWQRMVSQSWSLCRRLLLAYQRRESTLPRTSCSRSAVLQVSSRGSVLVSCCVPALIRVLGGGQPLLRDVVKVPADLWQATVRDHRIPQGDTQRDLPALEVGRMVRRIAILRLGLTAHDEVVAVARTPSGEPGFGPSLLGSPPLSRISSSRSSWTWRRTQSSRVFRRPTFRRCAHILRQAARSRALGGHRALRVFQLS